MMTANFDLSLQSTRKRLRKMNITPTWITVSTGRYYGNTQALVLTPVELDEGTVLRFGMVSDTAANRRRQIEIEAMVARLTTIFEIRDYDFENRATCQPPRKALAAHRTYRKLFGERLHASNYPSTASTVGFMELPGEIRNRIYRYLLVIDLTIEFAPKSSSSYPKTASAVRDYARARHKKLKPIQRLLRLSPEINREASDIFYDENEFSFSDSEGWLDGGTYSACFRRTYNGEARSIGLQGDVEKAPPCEKILQLCFSMLGQSRNLGSLRFILPVGYHQKEVPTQLRLANIASGLPITEVTLLHLCKDVREGERQETEDYKQQPIVVATGSNSHKSYPNPEALAEAYGWKYRVFWHDPKGKYTISQV